MTLYSSGTLATFPSGHLSGNGSLAVVQTLTNTLNRGLPGSNKAASSMGQWVVPQYVKCTNKRIYMAAVQTPSKNW